MKSSKSNTQILVARKILFEASISRPINHASLLIWQLQPPTREHGAILGHPCAAYCAEELAASGQEDLAEA